jgi:IclR family acetate operon transcriptional repressor
MENQVPAYSIQSVDNALHLLLMLRRDGMLRISDAAAELDVARSTAHRLISMLRFRGFVEQAPDRTYRPGPAFTDVGGGPAWAAALATIARPHLVRLTDQTNESSNIVIRVGGDIQFLESIECSQALRVGSRVGVRLSARATAAGKILLADLSSTEIIAIYPELLANAEARSALERTLCVTRRQGFAVCFAECERGVAALGLALRGSSGSTIAAVTLAAPTMRFKQDKIVQLLPALTEAVRNIRTDVLELAVPDRHRARPPEGGCTRAPLRIAL